MEEKVTLTPLYGEKKAEEKVALKILQCPTCGASLKAKNNTDAITCVYCGNTIVPVAAATLPTQNEISALMGNSIKVEGIRTPSSALAYIEQFFGEYDWEAFRYAQSLSVTEIDKLVNSLKTSSADDKNTWFACFKAISVPFAHKVKGCEQLLAAVIADYKADCLDAYSKFDAYKRITNMISAHKAEIIAKLKTIVSTAAKYGASATEVSDLSAEISGLKLLVMPTYAQIESIPEISRFNQEKNAKIVAELAAEGLDAEQEFARAKALIDRQEYAQALNILLSLKGFSDSEAYIEKLDRYFLLSDVLEIEDRLYYFKKDSSYSDTFSLYPTAEQKIAKTPIIQNISKIITNHADILYYLDASSRLMQYHLSSKKGSTLFDKELDPKAIYVHNRKVFLLSRRNNEYTYEPTFDLVMLDLITGTVTTVLKAVKQILSLTGNRLVVTVSHAVKTGGYGSTAKTSTVIVNAETLNTVEIGSKKIRVEGFLNDSVIYTVDAPNENNKHLYIRPLTADGEARLIEQNIYNFCDIIDGKLFYYIGNARNQTLIHINCDGTGRKEWPLYISEVLFEQGGWLYFIRRAGYNAILCRSRLDGSKYSIIAAKIDRFVEIKNGYLYYINDDSALVRVRMDGSNPQELCNDVQEVLSVREDKIVFTSIDDTYVFNEYENRIFKVVKSIYAVDFSGSGKIKPAYGVDSAKERDENTVYFIANQSDKKSNKTSRALYKLDVETNSTTKLLELQAPPAEEKLSGFAIAMVVMVLAFFIALMGYAADSIPLIFFGLLVGPLSLFIGLGLKFSKPSP